MKDATKVVFGALVGLIAGLAAKPAEFWITDQLKQHDMRQALYHDMVEKFYFAASVKNWEYKRVPELDRGLNLHSLSTSTFMTTTTRKR